MRSFGFAAIGVALLAGTAHAQTTITREITNEPVETIITRSPAGTVVTRWPAVTGAAPLSYAPAAAESLSGESMRAPPTAFVPAIRTAPVAAAPPPGALAAPVVAQTEIAVTPRHVGSSMGGRASGVARRALAGRMHRKSVSSQALLAPLSAPPRGAKLRIARPAARTMPRAGRMAAYYPVRPSAYPVRPSAYPVRRSAAPLALAPAERRIVYRTIAQQVVLPPAAPAAPTLSWTTMSLIPPILQPFTPPILNPQIPVLVQTEQTVMAPSGPVMAQTEMAVPSAAATFYPDSPYAANASADYADYVAGYWVGSRLPLTVPLVGVPQAVAAQVPAVARYSYAVIDNRVLLVDPASGIVVADVTP